MDNAFDILIAGFKGVHMQSLYLYGLWGFEHYNHTVPAWYWLGALLLTARRDFLKQPLARRLAVWLCALLVLGCGRVNITSEF